MDLEPLPNNKNIMPVIGRELNYLLIAPRISLLPYPQNLTLQSDLPMIPIGLAYVSSSIKTVSRNVYNLNLEFEIKEIYEAIRDSIEKYHIDVVLTGGLSGQFSKIKKVVDSVKTINKHIKVVVGGGVITSAPDVAMKAFECVDIGVIGEGEITAQELVSALNSGKDLKTVNGLIYRNNGAFVTTAPRNEIKDLNALPFPDYIGLGYDKLWNASNTALVVGARSCPFHCTFCFHPSGNTYRARTIDNIIREIDFLVKNYKIKTIGLSEELFLANRARIEEFCIKIKPYNITWACTAHAATFKSDLLPLMRESGCCNICIGVESASEKVLKSMTKKTSFSRIEEALQKIHENKIAIEGTLVFGDIAEDAETVEKTIQWWRNHRQYLINLTRIITFPGTGIYDYAVKNGKIKDAVDYLRKDCPHVNVSELTEYQYKELSLRLTTEEAFFPNPPQHFSVLSVNADEQRTLARYSCRCGYETDIWTRGILLSSTVRCPKCRQGYTLPYHEKYSTQLLRNKVEAMIYDNGNLAFWGLGREMQLLLRKIDVSSLTEVFIIDRDVKKQGLSFMDKPIHAPGILKNENIRVVIPTPILGAGVHYIEAIEKEVETLSDAKIVPFGKLFTQISVKEKIK